MVARNEQGGRTYTLEMEPMKCGPTAELQLDLTGDAREVISQIETSNVFRRKGRATVGLGIVTGDNKPRLRSAPRHGDEAIFTGKDIDPYRLNQASYYTTFEPGRFQQCAKESVYRASPKLIYRFIARELVVAVDTSGALTLNSANIIVPGPELNPYFLLGVLNARYATFYLQTKFSSLKVLKRHLEALPIPRLSEADEAKIIGAVRSILQGQSIKEHRRTIDSILESSLGISLD